MSQDKAEEETEVVTPESVQPAEVMEISNEINDEEFIILGTSSNNEFEIKGTRLSADRSTGSGSLKDDGDNLPKKVEISIDPEADFFGTPEPEDQDEQKVVEEIEGMTAAASTEEVVKKEEHDDAAPSEFQMDEPHDDGDTEHVDEEHLLLLEDKKVEIKLEEQPSIRSRSKTFQSSIDALAESSKLVVPTDGATIAFKGSSKHISMSIPRRSTLGDYSRKITGINYDIENRIRGINEEFDDDLLGFMMSQENAIVFDETVEEEQEVVTVREEEKPMLNRVPFYERHDKTLEEIAARKVKNFILQKKLTIYFRRKKMEYVTKETDYSPDLHTKYNKKLEAYGDFMGFKNAETARLKDSIEQMKKQRADKFVDLTNKFKKMQTREAEIGYGLINTKTGNTIPDKVVERLVNRQITQMGQVSSMRLTFIRLKQMVQEKLDYIAVLDEIAPGFLLADYEQLKSLNRGYADKIEEKDEELTKQRAKCASTIQILAHLREKSSALETDLHYLTDELKDTEQIFKGTRGELNVCKQKKDEYRHSLNKLRDESGLLTQPTLLRDMERGLSDVKILQAELTLVMKDHKRRARQIKSIRKKIETTQENRRLGAGKSSSKLRKESMHVTSPINDDGPLKPQIYKGRPSLIMPVIDSDVFGSLKTVKPKITYDRRRYPVGIKHNNDNKRAGG